LTEKTIFETLTSVTNVGNHHSSRPASSVRQTKPIVDSKEEANFNFFVAPQKAKKHIFFSEYLADESWI